MQSARPWRVFTSVDVEAVATDWRAGARSPYHYQESPGDMPAPEKDPKEEMIEAVHERPASRTSPVPTELKDLLELPGLLSFAADLPAAELFPMNAVAQISAQLLAADDPAGYGTPFQPLKDRIVELMALRGVRCRPEQVVLTTGLQPSVDLLGRLLVSPGEEVLLEELLSEKVRTSIPAEAKVLSVSTSPETGIDLDHLESLLAGGARPAFLYAIPEGHNPLGVSLSLEKRLRLVDLARHYEVPILEDDTSGLLTYDGHADPTLRALDNRCVVYLGSFSTLLAPALRAGWMVLPDQPAGRLRALPKAAELDVPSFSHRTIAAFLAAGYLSEHLETVRAAYGRRRDTMLRSLEENFHSERMRWSRPSSGLSVWMELPEGLPMTTMSLLREAVAKENVAFAPGSLFAPAGGAQADRALRLSFGNNPPHRIEDGIQRLARVIHALP